MHLDCKEQTMRGIYKKRGAEAPLFFYVRKSILHFINLFTGRVVDF